MARLHAAVKSGRRFPGVLQLFDAIVRGYGSALAAAVHEMALMAASIVGLLWLMRRLKLM